MMNDVIIGYRFAPTKEELVNAYLRNKNLDKTWCFDHVISEINICNFEPKDLPALSKIKSDDLVWYFFSPIVHANAKKKTMKRTAVNGFWKVTGPDGTVKDKRGSKIGTKKTLVYHKGKAANAVRTHWVMHEYHITYLPTKTTTYVLCQVKYKGDHRDISYGGNDLVVSRSEIVREINTVPEVLVVDQPVEDGLYPNDLSNPLNVQEDLCLLDAINPNLLKQTHEVLADQPVEYGLYPNDLSYPLNVQEDLCPLDAINPNLLQQTHEGLADQPVEDGLYLNDFSTPLNVQEDLLPPDAVNPNLLQQTSEVQIKQPVLDGLSTDDLEMSNEQDDLPSPAAFVPNTLFNLPPQTPYDDYYWNDFLDNNGWNFEDVIPDNYAREP